MGESLRARLMKFMIKDALTPKDWAENVDSVIDTVLFSTSSAIPAVTDAMKGWRPS